jgi:NAD(P)-dependent dehydrogenase (short-subunit alcohol dehydrogenase family)
MAHRGARHFVFLSRSGAEKPEALILLNELESYSQKCDADITVQVVRGDVSVREDVDKAISAAKRPIKGVIHAAAVFQARIFLPSSTSSQLTLYKRLVSLRT